MIVSFDDLLVHLILWRIWAPFRDTRFGPPPRLFTVLPVFSGLPKYAFGASKLVYDEFYIHVAQHVQDESGGTNAECGVWDTMEKFLKNSSNPRYALAKIHNTSLIIWKYSNWNIMRERERERLNVAKNCSDFNIL
jgi:hypothetical protein